MASKTFFLKLKETCQKIDSDVNDIKMKMIVIREDRDKEEVASKKICEIQDKISTMKNEACDVKSMLGPKLAHTRDFIKNFKELMAETEVSISTKEECLKQYGYTPMESVPQVPEIVVENNVTPYKKVEDQPVTPNILDYGISSTLTSTPLLNQKFSEENLPVLPDLESAKPVNSCVSDSTPTLNVADIVASTSKPKETPPFPEPLYTPSKETSPIPELLAYNSENFPNTPKLNI